MVAGDGWWQVMVTDDDGADGDGDGDADGLHGDKVSPNEACIYLTGLEVQATHDSVCPQSMIASSFW